MKNEPWQMYMLKLMLIVLYPPSNFYIHAWSLFFVIFTVAMTTLVGITAQLVLVELTISQAMDVSCAIVSNLEARLWSVMRMETVCVRLRHHTESQANQCPYHCFSLLFCLQTGFTGSKCDVCDTGYYQFGTSCHLCDCSGRTNDCYQNLTFTVPHEVCNCPKEYSGDSCQVRNVF